MARTAKLHRLKVHVFCFMSNHYHLVVTDPEARLPTALQYLDGLLARAINSLYGLRDHFWEGDSYNATLLDSPEVVVDRCGYVLANPVEAGLVDRARKWPGLWSSPKVIGEVLEFDRPSHFFRQLGYMPRSVQLKLEAPAGFESTAAFRAQLEASLASKEALARAKHQRFLGVARILKQRVLERPRTPEPRRRLRPRFAARDPGRRIELARRLKAFLAGYRDALLAWREGKRDVEFPEGTYLMRVAHQAVCAGAG